MSFTLTNEEMAKKRLESPEPEAVLLASMSVEALLELHGRITNLLPTKALKDMNLEQELVIQYQKLQILQDKVLEDEDCPANQRAQVANSVGTSLQNLAKMQVDQYSSERFKRLEMNLISLLNTWPKEQVESFLSQYEAMQV